MRWGNICQALEGAVILRVFNTTLNVSHKTSIDAAVLYSKQPAHYSCLLNFAAHEKEAASPPARRLSHSGSEGTEAGLVSRRTPG